jgi:CRISPR/Cas system endoribonuclease Cas6 (RAMP superfamily)
MIQFTFDLYPEDGKLGNRIPFGYKFRGVIMKWLTERNPELGEAFHKPGKIRPYAINTIPRQKEDKIEFILTSYHEQLSDTVIHDLLQSERVKLKVDGQQFFIARITFERPNLDQMKKRAKPATKLQIQFVTPVYFNTSLGDYPVRFPMPNSLFGNLVHLWNDINADGQQLERDSFIEWVNAHVYISGYKMRSAKRNIGKRKPVVGGLGNATYRVTKINRTYYKKVLEEMDRNYDVEFVNDNYAENCQWLDTLCKLGTYTNVGGNRTAGMGVIRYWTKSEVSEEDLISRENDH